MNFINLSCWVYVVSRVLIVTCSWTENLSKITEKSPNSIIKSNLISEIPYANSKVNVAASRSSRMVSAT